MIRPNRRWISLAISLALLLVGVGVSVVAFLCTACHSVGRR